MHILYYNASNPKQMLGPVELLFVLFCTVIVKDSLHHPTPTLSAIHVPKKRDKIHHQQN